MVEMEQARDPRIWDIAMGYIFIPYMYITYLFAYTMDSMFISCVMYGIYIYTALHQHYSILIL